MVYLLSFIFMLISGTLLAETPRFPLPKTPDQIWQNDLDLNDKVEVCCSSNSARIDALSILSATVASGSTNYIQNRNTLQNGSTFYVSSGTVNSFTALSGTFSVVNIASGTISNFTATQSIMNTLTLKNPLLTTGGGTGVSYLLVNSVSYTGNGTGQTVFHGLGTTPSMCITSITGTGANIPGLWMSGMTNSHHFNGTNITQGITAANSTTVTLGTDGSWNQNLVAYQMICFADQ